MEENKTEQYPSKIIDGKLFVRVIKSEDVFEGKGRKIQFEEDEDLQVAVIRKNGKLYCLDNICPHRHQEKMYKGIIRDMNIMCPEHGWTYSLQTGKNINTRQGFKSLKKFDVFEEDGYVWLEKPDLNIPKWRRDDS